MDLLGSILGSMEKPPSMSDAEKKKIKAQKELIEKQQEKERKKLQDFRGKIQVKINSFIKDGTQEKLKFDPMDKTERAIVFNMSSFEAENKSVNLYLRLCSDFKCLLKKPEGHEVADIASLSSFSFGLEEQDRYVMIWKKEFAPSDEELLAYRKDEAWDPEKAKQIAQLRAKEELESQYKKETKKIQPHSNYKDKYKHLIGNTAAKDAAQSTFTNRSYGFVSSENKRDQRTIEQVLAETRAKKKLKTEHQSSAGSEHETGSNEDCDKTVARATDRKETESNADNRKESTFSNS